MEWGIYQCEEMRVSVADRMRVVDLPRKSLRSSPPGNNVSSAQLAGRTRADFQLNKQFHDPSSVRGTSAEPIWKPQANRFANRANDGKTPKPEIQINLLPADLKSHAQINSFTLSCQDISKVILTGRYPHKLQRKLNIINDLTNGLGIWMLKN